jgi:hypothetical protein
LCRKVGGRLLAAETANEVEPGGVVLLKEPTEVEERRLRIIREG